MTRRIEWLQGAEGLATLAPAWRMLDARQPQAPFFTTHAWHAAWLSALEPAPERVRFAVLREQDRCVGIIPLLEDRREPSFWKPTRLDVPRRTGMDLSAPCIADDTRLADWWPVLRRQLKQQGRHPFILRYSGVPLDSTLPPSLAGLERQCIARVQNHSCWFDCTTSHEALATGYSTRLKKILRRGTRKLESSGDLRLRHWSGADLDADSTPYRRFLELEASGWKRESGTALVQDEAGRRFHENFLFSGSAAIRPRLNLLYCGDRAVAGQLCVEKNGCISLLKIAYDQSLASQSPGSVMLDALLRDASADPTITRVSLITGQRWMDEWGASRTPVADLWLFDRTLDAGVARGAAALRDRFRQVRSVAP